MLAAPPAWRNALSLPSPRGRQLGQEGEVLDIGDWDRSSKLKIPDTKLVPCNCHEAALTDVTKLTYWGWLEQRMLQEATLLRKHGVTTMMLENVAGPYFVRGDQPAVIYWLMRALAVRIRAEHPNVQLGIQLLAYSDDWAMDIACRCGLDFIRCESASV